MAQMSGTMGTILINPNTNTETTSRMVEIARRAVPGLEISGVTAPFGVSMIQTEAELVTAAEAVLALAPGLGSEVDGVIVSAFGDPGLGALSTVLSCPVVGIGEASFHEAAAGGARFGVATTTPGLVAAIAVRVEAAGLAARFTGTCLTPGNAQDLMADPEALVAALRDAVEAAIAQGADRVIIGGGPLAEAARRLQAETGHPIVAPVPAAARRLRALLG